MSHILAIETSIPAATIALSVNGDIVCTREFESHRQQNKLLLPALESILSEVDCSIDLIIVGIGPGSYSGSRIAIAAAQGLGIAYACPVVGLCSFLATETLSKHALAYAIGDARRGSYFIASIEATTASFKPELMDESEFQHRLTALHAHSEPAFMSFEESLPLPENLSYRQDYPTASRLISAWDTLPSSEQELLQRTPPQPAYLRAPFISKAKPGHPLLRNKK